MLLVWALPLIMGYAVAFYILAMILYISSHPRVLVMTIWYFAGDGPVYLKWTAEESVSKFFAEASARLR